MRELRLIGVHEDGEHLVVADDTGERSLVPIDEALRSAVRRDRRKALADAGVPEAEQVELRPRDVQALLRAGVSLEDVAERAGWSVEKVARYEGPIRAERDHVAGVARGLVVLSRTGGRSGEESTFGERVEHRLDGRGVASDDIDWDSWRSSEESWTVQVAFPAGGRLRQATWTFDPQTRALAPVDDEARWLGEDETSPGLLQPSAPAHDASVYDVEAEGGLEGQPTVRRSRGGSSSPAAIPGHPAGRPGDEASARTPAASGSEDGPVDLMAAMRARSRGRRRKPRSSTPAPQFPPDAAPREQVDTTGAPPPAGSRAGGDSPSVEDLGHDPVTGTVDMFADIELADDQVSAADVVEDPEPISSDHSDEVLQEQAPQAADETANEAEVGDGPDDGAALDSEEPVVPVDASGQDMPASEAGEDDSDSYSDDDGSDDDGSDEADADEAADPDDSDVLPDRPSAARKGRPRVPSWDDIMFGRRPGQD